MRKQNNITTYRLALVEDSTHENVWTIRFRKRALILTLITAVMVLIAFVYAIIAFTPLKTTIPGYPDNFTKREAVLTAVRLDSLESAITRWEIYAENLSRVLAGEQTITMDSILLGNKVEYLSELNRRALAGRDSLLREEVAQADMFDLDRNLSRVLPIEGMHFFTPLKGTLTRGFSAGVHPGVDLEAPQNSVVYSVMDGTVIFEDWDDELGYCIIVQHEGNVVSCYTHTEKLLRKTGDKIKAGTPIALTGGTGTLTEKEHLHLEIWYKGEAVDPQKYISF